MLTEDRICNTEVFMSLCLFIDSNIAKQKIKNLTAQSRKNVVAIN